LRGTKRNDANTSILFNLKEEKLTDVAKLKKRKQGRCLKLMGDLAMTLNCFNVIDDLIFILWCVICIKQDAWGFYTQAADILKSNNDFLWYGGTLEGISAVLISKNYLLSEFINPKIEIESPQKEKSNEQVFFFSFQIFHIV